MQFIPGSNKWDVLEHRSPGGDKHLHRWNAAATSPAIWPWPSAGAGRLHGARRAHTAHTGANTSDAPRLAYILIYNTPPVYSRDAANFRGWKAAGPTARRARRNGIAAAAWRWTWCGACRPSA